MTESPEPRTPDGDEQAEAVEVGEPDRLDPDRTRAAREDEEEARPDLDARERRVRTTRRPPGPPLRESSDRGDRRADESADDTNVEPTDPA